LPAGVVNLSGKSGETIIRTSTSGPVVISRGGISRVPVVRPLVTPGAARSRAQSSVIRTTLSRSTNNVVMTSAKTTRHVIPAASVVAERSASTSSSSQLTSVSRQPKTATVTRVQSNSKLVTGQGSVSLIQVKPTDSHKVTQGQKVVPGQKVAPIQPKVVKSMPVSAVAMIDPQPAKPATTINSSSSLVQSTATALRPLGEATMARGDSVPQTSVSSGETVPGGNSAQATDRLSDFDGLLTSALEDLDDVGGHLAFNDFSRPPAYPVRGGASDMRGGPTDMPMGYGYTGMDRQFPHPMPMHSPYLPYGMPPPPPAYPWMPPTMSMNPLWMQQPMGGQPVGGQPMVAPIGSQPMGSHVGSSGLTNRGGASDSFGHSDNFDFADGTSFEPLDANRSLTSLLADSEPPGFDMNFSRRNGTNSRNPGFMPSSYPGPPMISGYHPYHPYPMPYTAPPPAQKTPYYPPAPSATTQFCNPPGSGFAPPSAGYFPMAYPPAVPGHAGIYPGSGGAGYMQPGSAMMPGPPSYGLPAHAMAPPTAGESLTEFLLKNE